MTATDAIAATRALQMLSARLLKNGVSVARLAVEFATLAPSLACAAALRYASSNGIAADDVRQIVEEFEAKQDPKTKDRRDRQRAAVVKQKVRDGFRYSREKGPAPEWTRDCIMQYGRERRDILICAINVIEQGKDSKDATILVELGHYLKGESSPCTLEHHLKQLGFSAAGNVIPFVPLRKAATP